MNTPKIAIGLALIVLLAGCGGISDLEEKENTPKPTPENSEGQFVADSANEEESIYRVVDKEAGVVCYQIQSYPKSLNCLPMNETALNTSEE